MSTTAIIVNLLALVGLALAVRSNRAKAWQALHEAGDIPRAAILNLPYADPPSP